MLDTLLKIGEWQSRGKSKWERFLEIPKVDTEDQRGNSIKNYTLPIIFDLDNQEVVIDADNLEEFDEEKLLETIPLKTKGGNNKAIYTSVPAKKLNQIYKTFFGKEDNENTETGELFEAIEKLNPELLTDDFKELLSAIFQLKKAFIDQTQITKKNGTKEINIQAINDTFDLNKSEKLVFLTTQIRGKEFGYNDAVSFSIITAYKAFLKASYFSEMDDEPKQTSKESLCYASGNKLQDVDILNIDTRYSLNKMFVTETKNYASLFDKKKFNLNYQVSAENQVKLDYASTYLLKQGYKISIANVDHVIIPQFMQQSDVDLDLALEGIQKKSDLLFNMKKLDYFAENIKDWMEDDSDVLWLNFVAFESDGNFFKTTEIIKDVSKFHFKKLSDCFFEVSQYFQNSKFTNWEKVMTTKVKDEFVSISFNFSSLYRIIPVKEKSGKKEILKNKALILFKSIIENRKVEKTKLYGYFTESILCHYYRRYNNYTNVDWYGKDNFYFAVRDSVFKYLAFFQFLKKLNLIDMEETTTPGETTGNEYDQLEQDFFAKMNFSQQQKAMFYLGRMLNSVEYLQQGKNKTVIQKVNFNGMDQDNIQRLRIDLMEKAKQYSAVHKVIFTDKKFGEQFDYNNWSLSPQEALFFLLTGYSFGVGKKKGNSGTENESN